MSITIQVNQPATHNYRLISPRLSTGAAIVFLDSIPAAPNVISAYHSAGVDFEPAQLPKPAGRFIFEANRTSAATMKANIAVFKLEHGNQVQPSKKMRKDAKVAQIAAYKAVCGFDFQQAKAEKRALEEMEGLQNIGDDEQEEG